MLNKLIKKVAMIRKRQKMIANNDQGGVFDARTLSFDEMKALLA